MSKLRPARRQKPAGAIASATARGNQVRNVRSLKRYAPSLLFARRYDSPAVRDVVKEHRRQPLRSPTRAIWRTAGSSCAVRRTKLRQQHAPPKFPRSADMIRAGASASRCHLLSSISPVLRKKFVVEGWRHQASRLAERRWGSESLTHWHLSIGRRLCVDAGWQLRCYKTQKTLPALSLMSTQFHSGLGPVGIQDSQRS